MLKIFNYWGNVNKTTMRYPCILEWLKLKAKNVKCWQKLRATETLYTAVGSIKWYNHFEQQIS